MYNSFAGQDLWVLEMLNNKTNGIFVDLGAGDGITFSNTYLLEKEYNWNGICVESYPDRYDELITNRVSFKKNIVINHYKGYCNIDDDGRITESSGTTVECDTFDNIITEFELGNEIDYISINIGSSELDILKTIDFTKYDIKLITVQHNVYSNDLTFYKWRIYDVLNNEGFERIKSDAHCLEQYAEEYGRQPYEDWFINRRYLI